MNFKKNNRLALMLLLSVALLAAVLTCVSLTSKKHAPSPSPPVSANTLKHDPEGSAAILPPESRRAIIPVYLSKEKRIDRVDLETYVKGVIAAEMPIDFEPEALKAQAMAARTYMVRRIADHDFSGVPVKDAWVTDTVLHQAYLTDETLKERWKERYEKNMEKLTRAVDETRDLIISYQGRPIMSAFFSTSNGYTENSEDYWTDSIPYLRSVASPWDKTVSPEFTQKVHVPIKEFASRLGFRSGVTAAALSGAQVTDRSAGHRIKEIRIAGKRFTGREVRERLDLPSSEFEWKLKGSEVEITCFGYGHGIGMSQWGAHGMAMEGKTAEEIVKYYYKDIEIVRDTGYLNRNATS